MKATGKPPGYSVEFLPLERRLLERRSIHPYLTFLQRERRKHERRHSPAEPSFKQSGKIA